MLRDLHDIAGRTGRADMLERIARTCDKMHLDCLAARLRSLSAEVRAAAHRKVRHGQCPTCQHHGDDCTGAAS